MSSCTPFFSKSQLTAFTPRPVQQHPPYALLTDFFLDASCRTGKTVLLSRIQPFLSLCSKKAYATATSAVAAVLLNCGQTACSAVKISVPATEHSTCFITAGSGLAQQLRDVDLIICYEVFMCHHFCRRAVDWSLRDLSSNSLPLGGLFIVYFGHFRRILPVVRGASRAQIVNACVRSCIAFGLFKLLHLTKNMSLSALHPIASASPAATAYSKNLLLVSERSLRAVGDLNMIPLATSAHVSASLRYTCPQDFEGIQTCYVDENWLTSRVILATKKNSLSVINEFVTALIPGPNRTFSSQNTVADEGLDVLRYSVELLDTLTAVLLQQITAINSRRVMFSCFCTTWTRLQVMSTAHGTYLRTCSLTFSTSDLPPLLTKAIVCVFRACQVALAKTTFLCLPSQECSSQFGLTSPSPPISPKDILSVVDSV